jgi:ABC-type branched-subunit amino acid transport system substrate-binding protein
MPVRDRHYNRIAIGLCALLVGISTLAGCRGEALRVVKIGLVAPFEGRCREIGYDVIPAARLAIREYAARPEAREVAIELVAYDDGGDPDKAAEQAARLMADPDVVAVIGHWREQTTLTALPVYAEAGIPAVVYTVADMSIAGEFYNLAPSHSALESASERYVSEMLLPASLDLDYSEEIEQEIDRIVHAGWEPGPVIGGPVWGLGQSYALAGSLLEDAYYVTGTALPRDSAAQFIDSAWLQQFDSGFRQGSLDAPPGPYAVTAYEATWLAIKMAAEYSGIMLTDTPADGLRFDGSGRRLDAPVYLYQWRDGERHCVLSPSGCG